MQSNKHDRYVWVFLGVVVVALCFFASSCRTVNEFFDGKATVNKTTILLAILVASAVGAIVTGWFGVLAGGGAGTATTWLSATSPEATPLAPPHIHIPTFWESLVGFLGTTAGLAIVALVLWATWVRREWIVQAIRGPRGFRLQAARHAIWGGSKTRPPSGRTR